MTRADAVTGTVREDVFARDGYACVAPRLGAVDECRPPLTLDHIQDGYGRMGKRAPSDTAHLVSVCWHHHLDGWATAHRPELRDYIKAANGEGS